MKIEIGESLGYSFLRHIKKCWLVQTNWKASDHWPVANADELGQTFWAMREKFDPDGSVFGKTTNCSQLLKQGEVDVVGVGQDSSLYTVEIAFHEGGLLYSGGTGNQVLKKMLRTKLILDAYCPKGVERHIYFASPKVNPTPQRSLEEIFGRLSHEYPSVDWQLLTNEKFRNDLLLPTLAKVGTASDTSELFVRSAKLLELGGLLHLGNGDPNPRQETPSVQPTPESEPGQIQPLVRNLMQTVLEGFPGLLTESDRSNLTDKDYCRNELGLKTAGRELLRQHGEGTVINGHRRYYSKVYAGHYLVTSEWWKQDHFHNAEALLRWVEELIRRNAGQTEAVAALESHRAAFRNYLGYSQ